MDFIQFAIPGPNNVVIKAYVTIHGSDEELTQLVQAVEMARHNGPQVLEVKSETGASVRIIVDRLGPKVQSQ